VADPVSSFLRRMGQEAATDQRAINLARTALKDAIHFGRPQEMIDDLARRLEALEGPPQVQVDVPRAALDPVSVEYAAIGGPRSWAEQRVMTSAGESAMQAADGPTSEALDAIRSNALMAARLERLSPEQRAQSVAALAFQAADDARAEKLAKVAASERQRAQAKAVAGALGTTALGTAAGGLTALGIGEAARQYGDRMRQEQEVFADYEQRAAERRAVRQEMGEALGKMTGEINFAPVVDDVSGIAAAMALDIRDAAPSATDIFTEDPEIMLDSENQRDAIRRILGQRYGR
jgi:hypothetical protein